MAAISKAQLVKLQQKFKTDAAIGEQFGITRQAVHQLRKKYAIESVKAKNAERNMEILNAYDSGMSGTALAKKYKISISQTYRIINEARGGKKAPAKKIVKKAAAPVKAAKPVAKKAAPVKAAKPAPKKAAPAKAAKPAPKKAAPAKAAAPKAAAPAKKVAAPAKKVAAPAKKVAAPAKKAAAPAKKAKKK